MKVTLSVILSLCSYGAIAAIESTHAKKALAEFHEGAAVLLDVRENDEVATGRVKGALVFPKSRLGTAEWSQIHRFPQKRKAHLCLLPQWTPFGRSRKGTPKTWLQTR